MRNRLVPVLAAGVGLAAIAAFATAGLAQQQPPAEQPQEEVNRADLPPQPFGPQLAALMHLLIQPRHEKLGLAGKAENWILAGFYYNELKKS